MSNIYSDLIIENYKHPKNYGELKEHTCNASLSNTVCGDDLKVYLNIKNNRVSDISYTGAGCAICLGTMSILSEYLRDRSTKEISELDEEFILSLINMSKESGRIKCATLSLDVVQKCLNSLKFK